MTRPAGLILDYGNVLTRPQDQAWMDGAARRLGADGAAFRAAYWRHRHAYDADLTAAAYWGRVVAATRPGAPAPAGEDLAWLIEADITSWSIDHDEVWALAAEFRRTGGRAAFLSNSGPEMMARVRGRRPIDALFDAVVISCEVGLSKPDSRIYELCLDRPRAPRARDPLRGRSRRQHRRRRADRAADAAVRGPRRARAAAGPGRLRANLGNSLLGLEENFQAQSLRSRSNLAIRRGGKRWRASCVGPGRACDSNGRDL